MKIPKKIKICGIEYDVVIRKLENPDNFGMHVMKDCKLYISNEGTNKQIQEETFIHEILHAIEHILHIDLDERDVSGISHILYQVLKDNDLLKE